MTRLYTQQQLDEIAAEIGARIKRRTTPAQATAIAAGSTLRLEQQLLAQAGQPGRTVLAVGYTNTGRIQGTSLGANNVVRVYASGADFTAGKIHYQEAMNFGETIVLSGLFPGAIIHSTRGFYGFSELVDGVNEGLMPFLSFGLAFKETLYSALRGSQAYDPGGTSANQGWIPVVNGPVASTISLLDGDGNVIQGQSDIPLEPWQFQILYTDGNKEYRVTATNPVMSCQLAGMNANPAGQFLDCRLLMPMTSDGIVQTRNGRVSANDDNTLILWYARGGTAGLINGFSGASPGSPQNLAQQTGVSFGNYEPNGYVRLQAFGEISAYSGVDGAGGEATPMIPVSALSQVVAQPLHIADSGSGGQSGISIFSPFKGTARIYEYNTATGLLDQRYTVPLDRANVTVSSFRDQLHPASGAVSNTVAPGIQALTGQLNPGVIIADVPIGAVIQNSSPTLKPNLRSQNGTTAPAVTTQGDETLMLGVTPDDRAADIKFATDNIQYRRHLGAGGVETWEQA